MTGVDFPHADRTAPSQDRRPGQRRRRAHAERGGLADALSYLARQHRDDRARPDAHQGRVPGLLPSLRPPEAASREENARSGAPRAHGDGHRHQEGRRPGQPGDLQSRRPLAHQFAVGRRGLQGHAALWRRHSHDRRRYRLRQHVRGLQFAARRPEAAHRRAEGGIHLRRQEARGPRFAGARGPAEAAGRLSDGARARGDAAAPRSTPTRTTSCASRG